MKKDVVNKILIFWLSTFLVLAGCGGGGGATDTSNSVIDVADVTDVLPAEDDVIDAVQIASTNISGKVTLSSSVAGKASAKLKALHSAPKGKPGSKMYQKSAQAVSSVNKVPGSAPGDSLLDAQVMLFASDHPEWLYPIAQTETDAQGNYTLSVLSNSSQNKNAYTDGDPIPEGQYTFLVYKAPEFDLSTFTLTDAMVAIQSVVNEFTGSVSGQDLAAQPSDVTPEVVSMFGVEKNTDGTETWGGSSVELAPNAAIQVIFSMAMGRGSIVNAVSISPAVDGYWAVSADWLSATFYLNAGVQLATDTTYTVTVQGGDGNSTAVRNVYGNALANTATGSFYVPVNAVADTVSPTAIIVSPDTASGVDVITPIRIASNEILDVNNLLLSSTPSLGAKPGVMFIGEKGFGQFKYVYEFVLADPLDVGVTYTIGVSGGTDLAGNAMSQLNYAFGTATADNIEGVDATASTDVQSAQADVKDVFGKWVRSMNDHNLAQLQSMMGGKFVMEYDVNKDGVEDADINRDGRYSLAEFSDMIRNAFLYWDNCGTSMVGSIEGNINVNVAGDRADFEFSLTESTTNTSQQCQGGGPDNALFANLSKQNGVWLIDRVGDGIDIRDKALVTRALIGLTAPAVGTQTHGIEISPVPSLDGSTGEAVNPITFSWNEAANAKSYLFVIYNANDSQRGRAFALPTTMTSLSLPFDVDLTNCDNSADVSTCNSILPFGVVHKLDDNSKLSKQFGFDASRGFGLQKAGNEFWWEVIALGTNTTNDIKSGKASNIFRDIIAISKLTRIKNSGTFQTLTVGVVDGQSNPYTYSTIIQGYNVGSAGQITLNIATPNGDVGNGMSDPNDPMNVQGAYVAVYGHSGNKQALAFDTAGVANGVSVNLYKGLNFVEVFDGVDLQKGFTVETTGGLAPQILVSSVTDDLSNVHTPDAWGFVDAPGSSSVTITGTVVDNMVNRIMVNLWNDTLQANTFTEVNVSGGNFTVSLDIYPGENWINVSDDQWRYNAHLGIKTDVGSTWTAPIEIVGVTTAVLTENYGNNTNWDATTDVDNLVTISGKMASPDSNNARYWVNSDGGFSEGNVNLLNDNSFTLDVSLYNGWTYVSFDDGKQNWYGVNIFTANGKVVARPDITSINGDPMTTTGVYTAPSGVCSVTVIGTVGANEIVHADWNGRTPNGDIWDNQDVTSGNDDSDGVANDGKGLFTVTLPLVAGPNNFVNIHNKNWVWSGFSVNAQDNSCVYTAPTMTVDTVTGDDVSGNPVTVTTDGFDNYDAGTATVLMVSGTHSMPGRTIKAEVWSCGNAERYSGVVANDGTYSIAGVNIYDGGSGVSISDGPNWKQLNVFSMNGVQPVPVLQITDLAFTDGAGVTTGSLNNSGCDWADWMASTATSVTVSGTTTAADGRGHFWAGSQGGEFDIVSGAFTITVGLFDGMNGIDISDTDWNHYRVSIGTTNGVLPPQYVTITSHTHGDNGVSGAVTVSGTITTPGSEAVFQPREVWANIWDEGSMTGNFYHSNPIGSDLPLSFDANAGTFSFDIANVSGTGKIRIEVQSCGDVTNNGGACHGHSIVLNGTGEPEMIFKGGLNVGGDSSAVVHSLKILNKGASSRLR